MKKLILLGSFILASTSAFAQVNWVYDNTTAPSAVSTGTSDASLTTIWGDQVSLTTGGILDSFQMGIFNSTTGGNTGNLLTANVQVKFYDLTGGAYTSGVLASTKPLLATLNGTINFGAGLNAGFFSLATFSNLGTLGINLPQNIMITQQVTSFTGTTNRLGVVTYTQDVIGSSLDNNFYRNNGTGEGLFTFGTAASNKMAYKVGLVPEPASFAVIGLGLVGLVARRRKSSK